jgi:hypothetical protein
VRDFRASLVDDSEQLASTRIALTTMKALVPTIPTPCEGYWKVKCVSIMAGQAAWMEQHPRAVGCQVYWAATLCAIRHQAVVALMSVGVYIEQTGTWLCPYRGLIGPHGSDHGGEKNPFSR